jgi:hypothetical protein
MDENDGQPDSGTRGFVPLRMIFSGETGEEIEIDLTEPAAPTSARMGVEWNDRGILRIDLDEAGHE